NKLIGQREFRF
ncbi:hypothetical protein NPIL_25841, partial [Nephila pilipes]